ncbi:uncharacterized protein LOC116263928 [Nymphaea colorata]|nr:uncharacterized protein LOC116263928 [Nymphaea colorata]
MGRTACSFIFPIVLLPLGLVVVDMAESPFWYCTGNSNYTANSTFDHNLRSALASLEANVSLTSFYNATEGRKPDQVIAAVQCRGDLDGEACQACVSESTTEITQRCPNSRAALFAFQSCVMYYRDTNFIIPPSFMDISLPGPGAIPDPQRFRTMLISFFNKLIVSATTNPSGRLFWGDKFHYTEDVTVYCTAQCVRYLAPQDCKSCLDMAFIRMLKDFADRQGGATFSRMACSVRFETYPFFTPPSHQIDTSAVNFITSDCSPPASSGMIGTPFHRNFKLLLSYLTETAPISGFYNDAVGFGSNQVYGQLLCRGDVPVDVCWNCTAQASTKIQELCPNSRRATIWFDHCQLRYSDVRFAGTVDVYDRACQAAAEDASSPASFNQNLRILIANLTSLVAPTFPNRFFATGTSVLTDSKRINALVQCVRDIPLDQCRWCLQNASADIEGCCNGKQGCRILRGSCSLAFGVRPFFFGDPTFVSLPHPNHRHKRWWIFTIIGIIGVVVLAGVWVLCLVRRRQKPLKILEHKEASLFDVGSTKENKAHYDLPQISLKAIQSATVNFAEENKIGEGGYGPVYMGKLPNGQEVAVKRLSGNSGQGLKEFRNEIELIAKLQHTNLVRLIGCCLEKGEKLLIYEYMPNKSLDALLKDPKGRILLNWGKRSNIIMGIARGLLYLHQDSRLNIIHRDLKAGNVLLDEQLNPKISDFGMARIFSGVHGQETTSVVVGTYGYMAPEYAMDGVFSTKSDVYSFGILLLEIISGQLNSSFVDTHQAHSLVGHASRLWGEGNGKGFIDPVLKETSSTGEMLRCLQIGLLCIQDSASRPTMSTVVLMLGNKSLDLPLPKQPAFIQENVVESCQLFSSDIESVPISSTNGLSPKTACCFIFLVVLLLPLGLVDMAKSPFWYCTGNSNYTANSTFDHNLRRVLASLEANVSLTSFSNATEGRKPDQVTAVVQCRGDLDGEACKACVSESTTEITQRCPNSRAALLTFQSCIIYYRDTNFIIPPSFMDISLPGPGAIPDTQRFRSMLISFFNKLIVSATTNPSGRLFWGDKFHYTEDVTVYCTAQCMRNLAPQDCKSCLDMAFVRMLKDFADRQGGATYYRMACSVRFDTYPFFTPPSHQIDTSTVNFIASDCSSPASSGMIGTPFHRNFKLLLSYLTETAPISGFYNDAVGLGSNQAYGQLLCRGDVPVDVCWNCTAQASTKIQEMCPNSRRATIWFDHCQLRYSDVRFAGTVDVYDRACQEAAEDASSPASFNQNLRILISNLTSLVAPTFPNPFFATGTYVLTDSKRINALVQCVRDIPLDQCRWCLQNASADIEGCCNGKQGCRILRGSCSLAFGVQPFFFGDPTFVSLPHPNHRHKRWWIFTIIGIFGVVVLAGVWVLCLVRRRQKPLKILEHKEASLFDVGSTKENKAHYDLPQISLKAIQSATVNFAEENKIGEGGYGPVYMGKLPNGQVAVKRLSGNSGQGLKEFRNEIELIAKLQHTNLVRLIGCCLEKGEKMLIYEYMPNKSLDALLKDPEGRILLNWGKRSNIIMGIARGLLYLHQDSRLNIIHRDLKAGNVLLDEQLNPKISDFGMARIFSGVHGQETTSVVVGTYGYMAPEYAMDGVFSTKSDVYSFGILLLEIISGQLNSSFVDTQQAHSLVEHASRLWGEGNGKGFVDPVLKDTSSTGEMLRCLQIGLLCIQDFASRPTMSTVVLMLGNKSLDLPLPRQPAFI